MTDIVERIKDAENATHALFNYIFHDAREEIERLRAKIAEMERQEPVEWRTFDGEGGYDYLDYADNENYQQEWEAKHPNHKGWVEPLYTLPGARRMPSIPDDWLHVIDAASLTLAPSTKTQPADEQPAPSVSDSWLRAIDEALVVTHLGVADAADSYEDAKRKLNELISWHVAVATDPAVNGGFKLVPVDEQPVPRVSTSVITDYLVSISAHVAQQDDHKAQAEIGELLKLLAAAPELQNARKEVAVSETSPWQAVDNETVSQFKSAKYKTETNYMDEPK